MASEHSPPARLYRFGELAVDLRTGEVRQRGCTIRLQDKPLQLLCLLLEKPHELVTRQELQQRLWGSSPYHDFEDSLNQAVRKLRLALQDSTSTPRLVETIPRRGYRLNARFESLNLPPQSISKRDAIVSRQRERTELQAAYHEASNGRGHIVCVAGEPGVGKTTLCETFLADLSAESRCHVASSRCSERLAGSEAYLPILESLDSLMRSAAGGDIATTLRHRAPSWHLSSSETDAAPASQERRKREFVQFMEAITQKQPLVLFIDDLHWADVSTADLLLYTAQHCASLRLLLLGTYRTSDLLRAEHPLAQVTLELRARHLCKEIELSCFTRDDVAQYINLEFPGNCFPDDFLDAVYRRTEGNPLFLVDLLRELIRTGLIVRDDTWRLTCRLTEVEVPLPDSVRGMVGRKIGTLTAGHRHLLETASILGYDFDAAILARVLGIDTAEVEDSLDLLERMHRIVRSLGEKEFPDATFTTRYAFSHALYQNALYSGVGLARRQMLSAAAVRELVSRYGEESHQIALPLARLYELAGNWQAAAEWFCTAADNTAKLSGHREAVSLVSRSIEISRKLTGEVRDRLLVRGSMQLAISQQTLSQFEESIVAFEAAAEAAARLSDAETQIDALCGAAFSAGHLKRTEEMRQLARQARDAAQKAQVTPAYAEGVLGYERIFAGDMVAARRHLTFAYPALQQNTVSSRALFVGTSLAILYDLQSEYSKAERLLADVMEKMRRGTSCPDLLRAIWFRGMVLANCGRISDALDTLTEGMRMADLNGEHYWFSRFPNTIGWIYSELLDPERAVQYNSDGVQAGRSAQTPEVEANSHINLTHAYVALGDLPLAGQHLREGQRILAQDQHKHWLRWRFNIRLSLEAAHYFLARGDVGQARTHAQQSLAAARNAGAKKHMAGAHRLLGRAAAAEEKLDEAMREYRVALAILHQHPCPVAQWRTLVAAGRTATCQGSKIDAARLLESAEATVVQLANSIRSAETQQRFLVSARAEIDKARTARPASSNIYMR